MNVADLSLSQAIVLGMIPYLPGTIIKLITAAAISSRYSLNQ
jgi:biotin transport system substrate-specific component